MTLKYGSSFRQQILDLVVFLQAAEFVISPILVLLRLGDLLFE
jgi:hypothetical protein